MTIHTPSAVPRSTKDFGLRYRPLPCLPLRSSTPFLFLSSPHSLHSQSSTPFYFSDLESDDEDGGHRNQSSSVYQYEHIRLCQVQPLLARPPHLSPHPSLHLHLSCLPKHDRSKLVRAHDHELRPTFPPRQALRCDLTRWHRHHLIKSRRSAHLDYQSGGNRYGGKQKECVVCLEEYVDGVSRVMSLPCGHEFHAECM